MSHEHAITSASPSHQQMRLRHHHQPQCGRSRGCHLIAVTTQPTLLLHARGGRSWARREGGTTEEEGRGGRRRERCHAGREASTVGETESESRGSADKVIFILSLSLIIIFIPKIPISYIHIPKLLFLAF
jgi:hypothetical protein